MTRTNSENGIIFAMNLIPQDAKIYPRYIILLSAYLKLTAKLKSGKSVSDLKIMSFGF